MVHVRTWVNLRSGFIGKDISAALVGTSAENRYWLFSPRKPIWHLFDFILFFFRTRTFPPCPISLNGCTYGYLEKRSRIVVRVALPIHAHRCSGSSEDSNMEEHASSCAFGMDSSPQYFAPGHLRKTRLFDG